MIAIKNPKDFFAGLMFMATGGITLYQVNDLTFGTATDMGPGYVPTVLGWIVLVGGGLMLVRALAVGGDPIARFSPRPIGLVLGSILLFSFLIAHAGLIIAGSLATLMASAAAPDVRFREAAVWSLGLSVFCFILFSVLLGIPIQVWPRL